MIIKMQKTQEMLLLWKNKNMDVHFSLIPQIDIFLGFKQYNSLFFKETVRRYLIERGETLENESDGKAGWLSD